MAMSGGNDGELQLNANEDVLVPHTPDDGITKVAWSPSNLLATSSWDKSVRLWEVTAQGATPKLAYKHEAPVLCCAFSADGSNLVSAGCDHKVTMKDLQSQQEQLIGQHDAPVKEVFCVGEGGNMVISGSWDKTVKLWDCRQPQAAVTLQLPERCYAMDVKYPLMVVGCADRHINLYNLQDIQQNPAPYKSGQSSLKMQTRCVSCFPDKAGYAVGSIEGRCSIVNVEDPSKNFAFKCHRINDQIYAVNSIDFHPLGTFCTAGGDGTFVTWDKDHRQRLQAFKSCQLPLTSAKFNHTGDLLAYAVCYDWSKGHEGKREERAIFLHRVKEEEVKPKPKVR